MARAWRRKACCCGRGRDFAGCLEVDWYSAPTDGAGRDATAADRRSRDGKGCGWPARGGFLHVQGPAAFACGLEGPTPAHWHVPAAWADGCRQDAAGQDTCRTDVWRYEVSHSARYERIHGEVQRLAPRGFAAWLCGLRGRRPRSEEH